MLLRPHGADTGGTHSPASPFGSAPGRTGRKQLPISDDWVPHYLLNVGYPLESREAGGQRPRPPFETLYFEGRVGNPFRRDPEVVEELERRKMIQAPAPLPGRSEELRRLARKLGLPE